MDVDDYNNECMNEFKNLFEYVETGDCMGYVKCRSTGKTFYFKTPLGYKQMFAHIGRHAREKLNVCISWYVVRDIL